MDLEEIRTFVRTHLDVDDEELTTPILDRFIVDGAERIEAYSRNWPFRAIDYTFNTIADQQSYRITATDPVNLYTGIAKSIQDVVEVRGPNFSLKPIAHREVRAKFSADTDQSSEPTRWSRWGDDLYLWPAPSGAQAMSLLGYRFADELVFSAATAPDLPREFHELICWWALARGYAQQDDPEMADFYRSEFGQQLAERAERYTVGNDAQPLQMNRGVGPVGPWRYGGLAHLDWE